MTLDWLIAYVALAELRSQMAGAGALSQSGSGLVLRLWLAPPLASQWLGGPVAVTVHGP